MTTRMDVEPGEQGPGRDGGGRRGDTRTRIQQVALELFAEQGYERTSLREIAERLGVTKAALYYHFKSKEDIVRSFTEDYFGQLDALIAWASDQPPTSGTRVDILNRFIGIVMEGSKVFRFLEQNQASIRSLEGGKHRFEQFRPRLNALVELIAGREAPLRGRVRATAAIFSASISSMMFMRETSDTGEPQAAPDHAELRAIVLELADDLTRGLSPGESGARSAEG